MNQKNKPKTETLLTAKFVKGVTGTSDILTDGKFQVAFLGRSNVGKSTLINSLSLKSKLARTSVRPGKTIRMDFFLINNHFYFVDFPGYGYAARSQEKREKLAKMILWYLLYSDIKNRLVILILDAKVGITAFDEDIINTLQEKQINHLLVANKVDNLLKNQRKEKLALIQAKCPHSPILAYSSKKKEGREELLKNIFSHI